MKKHSNRPTGEIAGNMGSTSKHMDEVGMEKSMGDASRKDLQTGKSGCKSIERGFMEKLNIPGTQNNV